MAANAPGKKIPADLSDRLVIGPERARRQFIELIEQARSSIRIIDAKLSDPEVVTLLQSRRAGSPWRSSTAGGCELRLRSGPRAAHASASA